MMILSMTGYASTSRDLGSAVLSVDLRAVNSRFLEVSFRMPDELRAHEATIRDLIGQKLTRGKVECRLNLSTGQGATPRFALNQALLNQLLALAGEVQAQAGAATPLGVAEILRWPGVVSSDVVDADSLATSLMDLVGLALHELLAARQREGSKLTQTLLDRVQLIEQKVAAIAPGMPQVVAQYRDKLGTRLREASASLDEDRIRQEIAVFLQKVDVDEELDRLRTHLSEIRRVLKAGGNAGKRLDFLMQELHREANTLGSKSVSTEVSQASLDIKVWIEQMREQVQNIE